MRTFRRATLADLDDVMRVVAEAQAFMRTLNIDQWQDGYPEREILGRDVEIGQLYVVEDDGAIAAFAALSLEPEPIYDAIDGAWTLPGPYLTVHRMALDDAHRGGGIAREIIARAFDIARRNGRTVVRADTHPGNRAMRRFLEKQGFTQCGTVRYPVTGGDPLRVAYEAAVLD